MDGLVTGLLNDSNAAYELVDALSNAGYGQSNVSVVTEDAPAQYGPLQGVPVPNVPQELNSWGSSSDISNNYYSQIEADYYLVAVPVYYNDSEMVKKIFSDYGAKDIQYISR